MIIPFVIVSYQISINVPVLPALHKDTRLANSIIDYQSITIGDHPSLFNQSILTTIAKERYQTTIQNQYHISKITPTTCI